jgi:hypothetical protein
MVSHVPPKAATRSAFVTTLQTSVIFEDELSAAPLPPDLEVLASVVSALLATADEETDEGADDEVEEGQHRPIVPGLSERESGFPTPTR